MACEEVGEAEMIDAELKKRFDETEGGGFCLSDHHCINNVSETASFLLAEIDELSRLMGTTTGADYLRVRDVKDLFADFLALVEEKRK